MVTKIFFIIAVGLSTVISAQRKIVNQQNIEKFKTNKNLYIGKKVKVLLKDLKAKIKTASFYGGWSEEASRITLRFEDDKTKLVIFVKEHDSETNKLFLNKGNSQKRIDKDGKIYRSNDDILKKYENLTITDLLAF